MEITTSSAASPAVKNGEVQGLSVIESEVDLARGSWVLAEHVRPGDLVAPSENGAPFVVGNWVGCPGGFLVYGESGEECFCSGDTPSVFMIEADFMRKNFPGAM